LLTNRIVWTSRWSAEMHTEMTVDDAINVARIVGDLRGNDGDGEVRELAVAALRLARQVEEQSLKLERERARRRGFGSRDARFVQGSPLISSVDGGGRRDFVGGVPSTPANRCSS
jgi:hypothetical protein